MPRNEAQSFPSVLPSSSNGVGQKDGKNETGDGAADDGLEQRGIDWKGMQNRKEGRKEGRARCKRRELFSRHEIFLSPSEEGARVGGGAFVGSRPP